MKLTRIIFLTPYDPRDVRKWSGTIHSIYSALSNNPEGVEVLTINAGWITFCARALNKLFRLAGIHIDWRFSTAFALLTGAYLSIRLLFFGKAVIVAIAASNYLPYLKTRKLIIYISDGTFRLISESYPDFMAFPNWLKKQGDRNELISLRKSRYVIYPSRWASNSAKTQYAIPAARIFEIPFGPNIPDNLINEHYAPKSIGKREIRIVYVSADWARKNGDQAIEICRHLIGAGAKVRLITIGRTPAYVRQIDFVNDRGFLNKSDPKQLGELCDAYRTAHFFLMPTKSDASPIVFSEAQAFGVPPVSYDVGGVGSAIEHGKTGLLFPLGTSSETFAEEMMRYINNAELYRQLSERCRNWYLDRANWSNWSKLIIQLSAKSAPAD